MKTLSNKKGIAIKGKKIAPQSFKFSKKSIEIDLKNIYNTVKTLVSSEISDDFSKQLSRARDYGHVQNKLLNYWQGKSETEQKNFNEILYDVQDKYASDNTIEKIDAFLLMTKDEGKIKSFASYVAISEYLNSLNRHSDEIEQEYDSELDEFTTARQVIAMHYFFEELNVKTSKTAKARFIRFLTRKNEKNIYDHVITPFSSKKANFRVDDLKYIRIFFKELKLNQVLLKIDKELGKETI